MPEANFLSPAALPISYESGDYVLICGEIERVKLLQLNHGGWTDHMLSSLGKIGQVVEYDEDDLEILVEGEQWIFNPLAVERVSEPPSSSINTLFGTVKDLSALTGEEAGNRLRFHVSTSLRQIFALRSNNALGLLLFGIATGDNKRVEQLLGHSEVDFNCLIGVSGLQTTLVQAAIQHGQVEILEVCDTNCAWAY